MSPAFDLNPLSTPSIVGFVEAEILVAEVAADMARRVADLETGSEVPDRVFGDLAPMLLGALDAANSLHFRFHLTELGGSDRPYVVHEDGPFRLGGLDATHPNRKLTLVLPLRGRAMIDFPSIDKERSLVPGTLALFPSFLANAIEPAAGEEAGPVTAVVLYASGPSFV